MQEIERVIQLLARLPGLGPRSARRAALMLIRRKESLMQPLAMALAEAAEKIRTCTTCGNLDTAETCSVCQDPTRDATTICVVEQVADLWALERTGIFRGRYHVLGGVLSAIDGIGPEDLNIATLLDRIGGDSPVDSTVAEVILAMNMTVDGQTTAHYITERLEASGVKVSRLAHGVPVGGELDYLDDGTLATALKSRQSV